MVSDGNGESNKPTINWVTRTLCALGLALGGSVASLAFFDKPVPSELNTLAGIVIGGLLSMLTKSTPTASNSPGEANASSALTPPPSREPPARSIPPA